MKSNFYSTSTCSERWPFAKLWYFHCQLMDLVVLVAIPITQTLIDHFTLVELDFFFFDWHTNWEPFCRSLSPPTARLRHWNSVDLFGPCCCFFMCNWNLRCARDRHGIFVVYFIISQFWIGLGFGVKNFIDFELKYDTADAFWMENDFLLGVFVRHRSVDYNRQNHFHKTTLLFRYTTLRLMMFWNKQSSCFCAKCFIYIRPTGICNPVNRWQSEYRHG